MAVIRVVLVEPQPIFMQGVMENLEAVSDIEVVACVSTGHEGIGAIRKHRPDVAMVAIELPDMSGLVILEEVGAIAPVIFLTAEESRNVIFEAMRMGARGYLLKWNAEYPIEKAIRDVAVGKPALGATSLNSLLAAVREHYSRGRKKELLTNREREILTLVSRGTGQMEVAQELQLGYTTVRTHLRNVYVKLAVRNQAAAIREALRQGLITADEEVAIRRAASRTSKPDRSARGRQT